MLKQRYPGLFLLATAVLAPWVAVAAGADALLVDHGGKVLATPQVSAIYLGDYWVTRPGASDALHTDVFLQAWLVGPSVPGVLAQYGVGAGSFASSDTVGGASPSQFTDADAQALVQQEIAAGGVVTGDQTVHVVYLPPGTILTFLGATSLGKLGGYHSSYRDAATGKPVYYAVVVYSQGTNGIDFTGNARDNLTIMTSHVLAGALTDPDVGQGTVGWLDDVNGEVGDIAFALSTDAALGDVWVLQNGFAVALLWSNKDGKLDAGTATATIGATATGVTTLSISPATQNAAPGTSVSYTVTNAATAVDALALSVSGLPATVTATFAETSIAPGATTTLTLTIAADATTGTTTTFTVTGTDVVTATETASAILTIGTTPAGAVPPATPVAAADFSMSVTPTSQEMTRGGDVVTYTITTAQIGAGSTTLTLKALHLRSGIKAYLSRTRIAAGETATVTIMAHRDARRRAYEFVLKASSDQADERVTLTVVVK
jgi:hypothetical protein